MSLTKSLTTADLLSMSQSQLDELYCKSPAGAMPHGNGKGTAVITSHRYSRQMISFIVRLIFWQANIVNSEDQSLINRVSPFRFKSFKAHVYRGASQLCSGESIILDYSETSFLFQKIRDEIREIAPNLYLGQAFWSKRRLLSFILDFNQA